MISIYSLFWIVPVCYFVGVLSSAFWLGAYSNEKEENAYRQGFLDGRDEHMLNSIYTIKDIFKSKFENNFELFKTLTNGVIYGVEESGQMFMIFIDNMEDFEKYLDKPYMGMVVEYQGQYTRPIVRAEVE